MQKRYELTKAKYLLDDEKAHLLRVLERWKDRDPRNVNLLWMALYTGARAQEILNITREDFDPIEGTVFIVGLKGSSNREIPLPRWLSKRVVEMGFNIDGRLFAISYHQLRIVWMMYRPVKKKLHSLRHTFAFNLYKRTKDLKLVQLALGHRSIQNTMVYMDYQYSRAQMRRLIVE